MSEAMSDADELRIMAETLAPIHKYLAARLGVIADRVEQLTIDVKIYEQARTTRREHGES